MAIILPVTVRGQFEVLVPPGSTTKINTGADLVAVQTTQTKAPVVVPVPVITQAVVTQPPRKNAHDDNDWWA